MKEEVRGAFAEMLDISTDIDKAVLFVPGEVLASNMSAEEETAVLAQAGELVRLAEARAGEMGSRPFTQLAIETPAGYVFLTRELVEGGMTIVATGKRGSHVGLVLYDLRTCLRDARQALTEGSGSGEERAEA